MARKWTNHTVAERLHDRGIQCITDLMEVAQPSVTKVNWQCVACQNIWSTTVDSVLNLKSGCPHCAGNKKMSVSDCNDRLATDHRSFKCLSLADGQQNQERRGTFECYGCNKAWDAILSNVFSQKQGCPACGKSGRYNARWFNINQSRKCIPATLYLIELHDQNESFLKVGITKRSVGVRFGGLKAYTTAVVLQHSCTLYVAWQIEQAMCKVVEQYVPCKHFGGRTECFNVQSKDLLIALMNKAIDESKIYTNLL